MTDQHTLPSGGDVARYRELAIQRITYTHDEHGTAKLSAALHVTQRALAEAADALSASEAERERVRSGINSFLADYIFAHDTDASIRTLEHAAESLACFALDSTP